MSENCEYCGKTITDERIEHPIDDEVVFCCPCHLRNYEENSLRVLAFVLGNTDSVHGFSTYF